MSAMMAESESIKEGMLAGIFAENSSLYSRLICLGQTNIVKQKTFHPSRICIAIVWQMIKLTDYELTCWTKPFQKI